MYRSENTAALDAISPHDGEAAAITIRIRGIVQGVGFRPTVWQIASRLNLAGYVYNDGDGVLVALQGKPDKLRRFESEIHLYCPPLAKIEEIEIFEAEVDPGISGFSIHESHHDSNNTGVSPDAAMCQACLDDITDPNNRRFGYAFTNCTHCGPRLSIIKAIPYDRRNTSMAEFAQCHRCSKEYQDPNNRRFHAQPNACPQCGPELWLHSRRGGSSSGSFIHDAALQIRQGKILAIKGIGGFHLACDAGNPEAVSRLRQRKHRPHKALAMMGRSIDQIKQYCRLNDAEELALGSAAAPIVILESKNTALLPPQIAPGLRHWGFMLPYSPLHALLMEMLENPIVLTSGNRSHQPQCIGNDQALQNLAHIADDFLLHNREIINRVDDSVVRLMDGQIRVLRRARGYAPTPLQLPAGFEQCDGLLALGAEMKNTFCLLKSGRAILSQHMGDLENAGTWQDYNDNLDLYHRLYEHKVQQIAVDYHPEYLSTKLGRERAAENHLQIEEIQHHHAHLAACLADNRQALLAEKVIGITLDGLGFGTDGGIWGGELFLVDYRSCERLACLTPVAMPGGVQAIKQPWRNTYAHLQRFSDWHGFAKANPQLGIVRFLNSKPLKTLDAMIKGQLNSPLSSSCGRLFDAVAGILGVCSEDISYEGQAAMELEALITPELIHTVEAYPFRLKGDKPVLIDPSPMWASVLDDIAAMDPASVIAARFHKGLAEILVKVSTQFASMHKVTAVALSGGVFQNRILFELVSDGLRLNGLSALQHLNIPANDGGIALGQGLVAAARNIIAPVSEKD